MNATPVTDDGSSAIYVDNAGIRLVSQQSLVDDSCKSAYYNLCIESTRHDMHEMFIHM